MARRRVACGFCGELADTDKGPEHLSWFTHHHPERCSYRQDRMPALNGVHVGDLWQNLHTGTVSRVVELRLGGAGTYTDREACVVTEDVWRPGVEVEPPPGQLPLFGEQPTPTLEQLQALPALAESPRLDAHPLWSLVEHWEPLSRDDCPVPWKHDPRFGGRSAFDEWRGPAHRHPDEPKRDQKSPAAYWHAWHVVRGYCSYGWEWWQIDPDAPPSEEPRRAEQLELVRAR